MSGAERAPSNLNMRAVDVLSWSKDQENAARRLMAASSVSMASSRVRRSPSSLASAASRRQGRTAARAATMDSAIGKRAHSRTMSLAASGSAANAIEPEPALKQLPRFVFAQLIQHDR